MNTEYQLPVEDVGSLLIFCGPLDEHLRALEGRLGVRIHRRGATLRLDGGPQEVQLVTRCLDAMARQAALGALDLQQVHDCLVQVVGVGGAQFADEDGDETADPVLHTRRAGLQARTANQRAYLHRILRHDITFGVGPAGTGKTYLAVACAVDALERSQVQRIVLTRPAVEAGERLGFLPGDLSQKVDPYLRPLVDALHELMGVDRVQRAFEKGLLEIAPLAFMRGRTLNQAFVILDEAQNTTPEQMKMFLTRLGFGAKAVITGDTTQVDLPRGVQSGLLDAYQVLRQVPGIAFTEFGPQDVVRHPLVARIVEAYEKNRGGRRHAAQR